MEALAAWIAAHRSELPATLVWRETSLQHFNVSTGQFGGRRCFCCSLPLCTRIRRHQAPTALGCPLVSLLPPPLPPLPGEFPTPGRESNEALGPAPYACTPLQGAQLSADGTLHGSNAPLLSGGWRNALSSPAMRAAGVPVLGVWNESLPLHRMHAWGECTHYCFPGAYDSK